MISADSYVLLATAASVGVGAVLSGAGALMAYLRHRNYQKLVKLAGGRFDNDITETPNMREPQDKEHAPITFRFQISNIIEQDGYRAQIIINRSDVEIEGEVDGHAFNFHASDWWAFGVSKDKLSEAQLLDVCTNKQVTDEHPIAQAVTGPYAFVLRENPGAFMTHTEAMMTDKDCIAKFRASVQEALRQSAAIEG